MTTTTRGVLVKEQVWPSVGYEPHAGQLPIHRSLARHKVVSAGRRFGKSQIGGHELTPEALFTYTVKDELKRTGKRREFWVVGPEYCVDEETEILTQRGWLSYDEVVEGDVALTLNAETGLACWSYVTKVSTFEGSRPVTEMNFRGHSSVSTMDHRWLVEWGNGRDKSRGLRWTTTKDLGVKSNERVPCAKPVSNLPTEQKYSDALVELVAWYWTEGHLRPSGGITISQSSEANPNNCDDIRRALLALFGKDGWKERERDYWYVNVAHAEAISQHAPGQEKVVRPEFLCSLTQAQLNLFIEVSIKADGHERNRKQRERHLWQKSEARCDSFQMACQMAGIQTTKISRNNGWVVQLFERSSFTPFQARRRGNTQIRQHDGIVWCPTTDTGTWLARRNGTVYFTGNSDSEKEFRVLYNDLQRLEVPFDKPGTYNNPESGEMVISLWGGRFIVHAKSAKYPGTLVGEELAGVILAEAAKLKQVVWTKYLRPTLADSRGWSLHTSTPEGKNWFYELWRRGQDPKDMQWASWRVPSWANPVVFPEGRYDSEIVDMAADMSVERFNQEIGADFTEFVGRVFKDFEEETHVKDLMYRPDLPLYGACDYGWTNPFVWLVIQVDVWGTVYVLAEYRVTQRDINDIARDLGGMAGARQAKLFYPDPASPGDTAVLSKHLQVKANTNTGGEKKWRLELIRQHLKLGPEHIPEEQRQPRIYVDRSCRELIREMQDYRYPDTKDESLKSATEEPMDKDDHGPEALGRFFRGHFGAPPSPGRNRARVRKANMSGAR